MRFIHEWLKKMPEACYCPRNYALQSQKYIIPFSVIYIDDIDILTRVCYASI